ncbi:MAG: LptF/LptG family permease [Phycisphaerales bacterium]
MLWTLWRSILFEFWRMLLITTSVVVAAIAFATTVKPLADGSLSIDQAFRFLGYAIPPMLAYALPFAAGFSATMTYHRMVSENELTATFASGVSHRQVLFPMLVSGVLLAGGLVALNNQIIPRFLQRMEEMVTRDFAKILVNSLSQGQSAMVGNTEIHADRVEEVAPEAGSPIEQQFLLGGVVMVEANDDGSIRIDGTAARAWILLLPAWALSPEDRPRIANDNDRAVVMKFEDLTINEEGDAVAWDSVTSPAIPIPRVFKDDPKFMSAQEMEKLEENPDLMNFVDRRRIELARAIASTEAFNTLSEMVSSGQAIDFRAGPNQTITVLAGSIERDRKDWVLKPLESTGTIEIEIKRTSNRSSTSRSSSTDRLSVRSAIIHPNTTAKIDPFDAGSSTNNLAMELELFNITIQSNDASTQTQIAQTEYANLNIDNDPLPELLEIPSARMLEVAQPYRQEESIQYNSTVSRLARNLEFEVDDLGREVLSKIHERWAFSVSSLIMVLAGGVTAMRLRHAQPLMIYLWSFFPALLTVLFISGGQQAVHKSGAVALPLLWSGILLIIGYTLNALRKVSKH